MKHILNISVLTLTLFYSSISFGQTKVLDSLIQNISNKQAYILLTRTMSPRINSTVGIKIIQLGKAATPELIKVLDDQNKGIIAHFILSEIWKERWNQEICCAISNDGVLEIISINGLKIYIDDNTLFAKKDDLKRNKERWRKIWES